MIPSPYYSYGLKAQMILSFDITLQVIWVVFIRLVISDSFFI